MRSGIACLIVILPVAAFGCDEKDARLVEMAREAANRQAEQNNVMAYLQEHVTSLQRDLQQSQTEIGRQRDRLEGERREIAAQRHRDPLIASAITTVGLVVACLLPLLLAAYIIRCLQDPGHTDAAMTEVLVRELVAKDPLLLPSPDSPSALEHQPSPAPEIEATAG